MLNSAMLCSAEAWQQLPAQHSMADSSIQYHSMAQYAFVRYDGRYVVLRYACYAVLSYAMLRHAKLCHATPCHAMPCYAVLCWQLCR